MAAPAAALIDGTKACSSCGIVKQLDEFRAHPTGLGGRRSRCQVCDNARKKAWRQQNRELVIAQKRRYRERNAERLNEERRGQRNDATRALERAWWHANPDRARAQNHKRRVSARSTDPVIVARIRELLAMPCAYCGANDKIEIDHVVPLARGGLHEPCNLAAACQHCNRSKKDRLLSEWRVA